MSQDLEEQNKLRQYLLGELSHEEQVFIEQRLFLESPYAQLAQTVEDDLVDDYLHNDLTAGERKGFESHFLNQAERRVDLKIAQALKRHLASEAFAHPVTNQVVAAPGKILNRRAVWFALAVAVLIVISIVAWIAIRSTKSPHDRSFEAHVPQSTPTEVLRQQPEPSPVNPNNNQRNEVVERRNRTDGSDRKSPNQRQPDLTSIVTATILPNLTGRGEGKSNEVTIPRTAKGVLLQIPVITIKNYDRYRFELLSAGRPIEVKNLNVSVDKKLGRVVSVLVPTKRFNQQRYEIQLHGLNPAGVSGESTTYIFTIKKEQK